MSEVGHVLEQLLGQGAGAGDDLRLVVGVHHRGAGRLRDLQRGDVRRRVLRPGAAHPGAVRLDALDLHRRRGSGTTTVARTPSARAAKACARPALPPEAMTIPAARSPGLEADELAVETRRGS